MDKITKRNVFNEVVTRISTEFKEEGFKYYPSNKRILRYHPIGFDVIIFRIIDYNPKFQIETSLGLRINVVEDIINKFLAYTWADPKYMRFSKTIDTSYRELSGSNDNYIEVESEEDLDDAIVELIDLKRTKGLPFFEQYKDIEVLNQHYKEWIQTSKFGAYLTGGLMESLILMKLCNDPDFEGLSKIYKEKHTPFRGEEADAFKAMDDLIDYLNHMDFLENPIK